MRVAFVVPYVPNLIRVRSYHLLSQLVRLGAEVTLYTISTGPQDLIDIGSIRSRLERLERIEVKAQPIWLSIKNCMRALPSKIPLQAVFSWNRHLQLDLDRGVRSGSFDIVHVEHLRGSTYGVQLKSQFPEAVVVWDSVDCISHLFKQTSIHSRNPITKLISRIELKKTQTAEGELTSLFDHVLVTSKVDKEALAGLTPKDKLARVISVLPNGVDIEYFQPPDPNIRDFETIVFSGKMSYHANLSMVDRLVNEVMPLVWERRSTAKLLIVGKDPPPKIRRLSKNPLIHVTGTVDDIRPFLHRATVAVVPLVYGAGIQNKILEAMASGTPVVTSLQTISALQAVPERDILLADTPQQFAESILELIEDQDLWKKVSYAGFKYVKKHHDWNRVGRELFMIYTDLSAK